MWGPKSGPNVVDRTMLGSKLEINRKAPQIWRDMSVCVCVSLPAAESLLCESRKILWSFGDNSFYAVFLHFSCWHYFLLSVCMCRFRTVGGRCFTEYIFTL